MAIRAAPERAATPAWDTFVATVWPDPEVCAWALRVLAVSLAGYPDAALPVLYGRERSGKTSLVTLLVDVLGGYGLAADPRLLSGAENTHASVIYALKGRRLAFIDEGPRRGHLAAERLKQLTGGGHLTGNAMRANPVTFRPTHTLVMTSNDEPPITDPALRARIRAIPCDALEQDVRPAREAITPAVWQQEAPGVLAMLMRECAAWLDDRTTASNDAAPASVIELTRDIAARQDPVLEWIEMCTVPSDPGTSASELYERFCGWYGGQARFGRTAPPSLTAWGRALTDAGYPSVPKQGPRKCNVYRPLAILNGPGAPLPLPLGLSTGTQPSGPSADSLLTVSDSSKGQLSAPSNPRSTGVFDATADSSDSSSRSMTNETTHTTPYAVERAERAEKVGEQPSELSDCQQNSPPPAVTRADSCADSSARTVSRPSERADDAAQPVDNPVSAGHPASEPEKITREAVAALAYTEGITKTEARARLSAQRKQAMIEWKAVEKARVLHEAQGEVLPLPVAVDRAGHTIPVTPDQAAAVVRAALGRTGALTVDVEHTGYPLGHRHYALRTVQLGDDLAAVVLDPDEHAELIRALLTEALALHAHSATADLIPLAVAGLVDLEHGWARMHDTTIPALLADPSSTGSDPGLKQLAGAMLGPVAVAPAAERARAEVFKFGRWLEKTEPTTPLERSGWAQINPRGAVMLRYAASDVLDTAAIAKRLPGPDPAIYARERTAQTMTARLPHRGLRLDGEHIARLAAEHEPARTAAGARVQAYGIDNPGSDQQVGLTLARMGAPLPLTATGRPSVAAGVLEPLRRAEGQIGELVEAVLTYRHHDTVLGTFLGPYRELVEHGDGRARPTVYTLGTNTGRMSCVRPNLQQLPRQGGVRACITADPGQLMIGADFSGVELRVAAALSQDPTLMQLIADGVDVHGEVALIAFGSDAEASAKAGRPTAAKEARYMTKRGVFGWLYGGGIRTLAAQVGTTQEVMQQVVDTLCRMAPGLPAWSESVKRAVQAGQTQFRSYSGRVIHLPRDRPHACPNYCVGMSTPVLRSDLQHVAASEIRVGDRLVAFDEHPAVTGTGENRYHYMRTAVVEAVSTVVKPSLRVHSADGKVTECSTDHLWLVRPLKGRKNNRPRVRWVRADELQPGDDLLSLGTWDVANNRTAGYLAGLYDGEGSLTRHTDTRRKNQLFFSQNTGQVMDAFQAGMTELALPHSYYRRTPNSTSTTDSVVVSGMRNVMRTLGTLQPARFRSRFEALYEGNAVTAGLTESVPVIRVEVAGEMELSSIQTSTRTLVANGYLSHNCIQGSARELLVDALVRWQDTRWGACTVLPVHDELDVFVPAEDAQAATEALVACMQSELFGVQIVADPSEPAHAWADSS